MYNTLILSIKGKNIENFIRKLNKRNIEILNITYIKYNEIKIEIKKADLDNIMKIKTIYDINILEYKGIDKIKNKIIFNKYILLSLLCGLIIFTILTNMIFSIEISYNNSNIRNLLSKELESYGIKKYRFIKHYNEIQNIKNNILETNKDKLEWLEIERIGTKYIVRVEPRMIKETLEDNKIYNVVSKKDAIIKRIEASSGEIIKNINDYVKKGDIIISSEIKLFDEVKNVVSAGGVVYGEVWYSVKTEYPLNYYEEKETGNKEEVYNLKIINKDLNFSKIKNVKTDDKIILKSDLLPISLTKQTRKEIEIINYKLTEEEAYDKAILESRKKIMSNLGEEEYIIDEKSLKIDMKESKIVIDMFYTVYEDITSYLELEG